jgi:putative transcriptional regulator
MDIFVHLDVMLAKRKMRSKELAERINLTEQSISLLKSGKVRGIRFDTLAKICAVLDCQPGDILEYRPDPDRTSADGTDHLDRSRKTHRGPAT